MASTPKPTANARLELSSVLTHSMEDYIKIIYKIQQQHVRATTIRIAERLGFSAASVTNMLQKLARLDLVQYTPYQGAELTETGRRIALEIIRHHRLLELYLAERLGYSWDEVDAEAEALEHVISEEFEERIDKMLGYPDTDPHGDPIPSKEGVIHDDEMYTPLNEIDAGQPVVVRRVSDRDSSALRRFADLGLFPGTQVEVLSTDENEMRLRVEDDEREIETEQAGGVYVQLADPDAA